MKARTAVQRRIAAAMLAVLVASAAGGWITLARGSEAPVLVYAAASLKTALDRVAAGWSAETGQPVTVSYGASSALARQIDHGAPADIFISANESWMDEVETRGLILPGTRFDLLGNALVLIAPAGSPLAAQPTGTAGFPQLPASGRIAMANTRAVPAGIYGKAALEALGQWDAVQGRIVEALDVRAALVLVARGEVPLGIVYATDAVAEPRVRIMARFPEELHDPIRYPAALVVSEGDNPHAPAFLAFLKSAPAREIFEAAGFRFLADEATR